MANKTIAIRDVSEWKNSPVLKMLREYRNLVKEKGGVRAFFDKFVASDDEFCADLLHRHVRMNKQETINYLEMLSYDMRRDKYFHAYVEFVGQRTKPFISKLESGPRQLCVTYAYNAYDYGLIFMWYDLQGTFLRYVFVPHINEETGKIDKCSILLDVEIYNYQVIEPPASWQWDETTQIKKEEKNDQH